MLESKKESTGIRVADLQIQVTSGAVFSKKASKPGIMPTKFNGKLDSMVSLTLPRATTYEEHSFLKSFLDGRTTVNLFLSLNDVDFTNKKPGSAFTRFGIAPSRQGACSKAWFISGALVKRKIIPVKKARDSPLGYVLVKSLRSAIIKCAI